MRPYLEKLKVPESVLDIFDQHFVLCSLAVIVLGITLAFFGYKLFNAILVIGSAVAAGFATDKWLLPLFADKLPEIPVVELSVVITVAVAGIGALLAFKAKKFVVFIGTGAGIYFLMDKVLYDIILPLLPESWTFMSNGIVRIAVSAVCALVLAIIIEIFFKLIFIVGSSLGGMAIAAVFLANLVILDFSKTILIIAACAGAAIGIIAACVQFAMNPRYKPIF